MAVHVHVLARRWLLLAFAAVCRAASRGVVVVRTCKHALFVSCELCLLAGVVLYHR